MEEIMQALISINSPVYLLEKDDDVHDPVIERFTEPLQQRTMKMCDEVKEIS